MFNKWDKYREECDLETKKIATLKLANKLGTLIAEMPEHKALIITEMTNSIGVRENEINNAE